MTKANQELIDHVKANQKDVGDIIGGFFDPEERGTRAVIPFSYLRFLDFLTRKSDRKRLSNVSNMQEIPFNGFMKSLFADAQCEEKIGVSKCLILMTYSELCKTGASPEEIDEMLMPFELGDYSCEIVFFRNENDLNMFQASIPLAGIATDFFNTYNPPPMFLIAPDNRKVLLVENMIPTNLNNQSLLGEKGWVYSFKFISAKTSEELVDKELSKIDEGPGLFDYHWTTSEVDLIWKLNDEQG